MNQNVPNPPRGPRHAPVGDDMLPELLATSDALDRLGAADRAAAPASLEDRVFLRTCALLPATTSVDSSPAEPPIAVIRPSSAGGWRVAAAAGLAFVGMIGAIMLAGAFGTNNGSASSLATANDTGARLGQIDSQFAEENVETSDWSSGLAELDAELARLESTDDGFWKSHADEDLSLEESM